MRTIHNSSFATGIVPVGLWTVDPAYSSVEFAVKHMMIANVRGRFSGFEVTLEADAAGNAQTSGVVRVASIDTNHGTRDEHLRRSLDFFDVEHYPEIRFRSSRIEPVGGSAYRVVGRLTIKNTTHEIELKVTVLGYGRDPRGNERVALEAVGEIDRREFGLSWNQPLETGGVLIGNKVRLELELSAVRNVHAATA